MSSQHPHSGRVYLVGAGPGDPGLITLKGAGLLKQADVIIYDYLASPSLLDHAREDAELIFAGKRAGNHTLSQAEINDLLVKKAKEGKIVVRLKGGDPFVFGRGGEEALALRENDVPFEVVPGVTSAIAAAAYAGIPVTHRGVSTGLYLVTGHEDPAKGMQETDWRTLASVPGTIAIYMGMGSLRRIAGELIAGGKVSSTPAAVISWGTIPRQRCATGTLETIADETARLALGAPAIVIIGETVTLRDSLNWFESLPLFGRRIVCTRPRRQSAKLEAKLRALGADVLLLPTIKVEPAADMHKIDDAISRLHTFDWIIFTSINGVEIFFNRMLHNGRDARSLADCRIAAIGPATAEAIRSRFLNVDCMPKRYIAEEIIAEISRRGELSGKRILLPRAASARAALAEQLAELGAEVEETPLYDTLPETEVPRDILDDVLAGKVDAITFTSSSTVSSFAELAGADTAREISRKTLVASIGPITSDTARKLGLHVGVEAEEYTVDGLVEAIAQKFAERPEDNR